MIIIDWSYIVDAYLQADFWWMCMRRWIRSAVA